MAMITPVEKVQLGVEAAYGDAAAATVTMVGVEEVEIEPHVDAEQLVDKRGTTMPAHEAVITRRWCEGTISGYLNYQQAYLMLDGMFGFATPVGTVRTWLASLDWTPEVEKSMVLYYGQTGGLFKVAGLLPSEIRISGGSGEAVKYSVRFFGLAPTDGAVFAAVADPAVNYVMGSHCVMALDSGLTTAPGATALADTAFRFEAVITANRRPVWHLGEIAPDSWRNGRWGGSLRLTLEATATVMGYLGDILDAAVVPQGYTTRIRMTNASQILDLRNAGHALVPPRLITDDDGITTVELDLAPAYGSNVGFVSCWGAELTLP